MSWCVVCCELCGAVGARAGSECEAAVGWERAASRRVGALVVCVRV